MWKLPTLETTTTAPSSIDTDVVAVFQDSGKKALAPKGPYGVLVEKFRKGEAFAGRHGSQQYVRFGGKSPVENVLFSGFGTAGELTEERARMAGGSAWQKLCAEKAKSVAIQVDTIGQLPMIRAFAEGMILACYGFTKYKSKAAGAKENDYTGPSRLFFVTPNKTLAKQVDVELEHIEAIGNSVNVTRDWSNEPANVGTPQFYAAEAQRLARQYGVKCRILTEADAAREKMGLFLAVGQGSEREGRIVVMEYTPKAVKNPKTLCLVGKGITFDTGGISIKPSMRMEEMKHDMTGAATVMGAILLAAQMKVPNRVVAIMGFTENMPDGNAVVPSSVVKARNGKTVEIINTDAEGRLILADLLDFAHDFKPDAIVNVATLTGAVAIALGKHCCGIMGNDQELIDSIRQTGDSNGERLWQLPMWDEYFEDLKSDTADMKNSANDSYGGTIRGAMFMKQFIRKGTAWAHLDIATTSTGLGHLPYYPKKGASGSYVRTLAKFASEL